MIHYDKIKPKDPPKVIDKSLREQYNAQAKQLGVLSIKVTPHHQHLVEEELTTLGRTGGPLYRVAYPTAAQLEMRAVHEMPDFVEDRTNMPTGLEGVLIHKYHQRALFLVTDKCAGHCMYCFRQDVMSDLQNQTGQVTFQREGKPVIYHDFPSALDEPNQVETLLWKG